MKRPILRRLAALLTVFSVLVFPVHATWSIVVVNTKTGEVSIAGATCLQNFNLKRWLPVMRVGVGGGVAQGLIDTGAPHRIIIWNGLIAGDSPQDIIATLLAQGSTMQARQFGVVNFSDPPATFSGINLGQAFHGVTGVVGDLRYAIQGNVLTGREVVDAAEAALLGTPGDLSQKVIAGMEAARALGGDGRCSCTTGGPTACGVPPPGFVKAAHVAFMVHSRMGDTDGGCIHATGCATGSYYLALNVIGDDMDIDPVVQLQADYDVWRTGVVGRPDHILSTVSPGATALVADGVTSTDVTLQLVDVDGTPLSSGGATLTVAPLGGGTPFATPGAVTDHGDGSYTFPLTAGPVAGDDTLVIQVDDGTVTATLFPFLELSVDALAPLHVGLDQVSAGAGADVPFVLNLGSGAAGDPYVLLGSVSGTAPGIDLGGGLILPLNDDWFLHCTLSQAGSTVLPGSIGTLDAAGRAEASFVAGPGPLLPLVGLRMDWSAVNHAGPLTVTGAVGFDVLP